MPASSLPALLREYEEDAEEHRQADLCMLVRHEATGETLLEAGGRWDFVDRRWLPQEPETAKILTVHEGQAPFFRYLAEWLPDFRNGHERGTPRQVLDRMILAESGRRAGKTRALQAGLAAVVVDVPWIAGRPLVTWIVSKSHEEEEEIRDNTPAILPSHWWTWKERLHRYQLVHGSYIALLSSDRPTTTKRGKVDVALVNEAQKQRQSALTNLIYGTADSGGCTWLAANPNDSLTGEWVARVLKKIEEKKFPRARHFYFDPKMNVFIDQVARADVDAIVREIDPKQADRDGGGLWIPLIDKAYYRWSDERHLRPPPELGNCTNAALRKKLGSCTYTHVAGLDFQRSPGCCAVIFELYGDPANPILHVVDEVLIDRGSEYVLSDALYDQGYEPDSLLLVADATGQQQDFEHRSGQDSFTKLRSRGWHVEAPQKKRTAKGKYSINPPIPERLKLVNEELGNPAKNEAPRLLVDPERAPVLAHCFKECILTPGRYSTRIPSGEGWLPHMTDGAGYVIWWLKPPPMRPVKKSNTAPAVPVKQPGAGWWPR